MERMNVFAYTAQGVGYPSFISVNVEECGKVVMHARAPPKADGSCGDSVTVEVPRAEIPDMIRGLSAIVRP